MDNDKNDRHPARIIISGKRMVSKPQESTRDRTEREHLEKKEAIARKIEIAALTKRLAQLEASPEFKQELSEAEKIDKDFSNFDAKVMGLQTLERNRRREYAEEFKSDPEMLEMKNLALDEYVSQYGLTPNRHDK